MKTLIACVVGLCLVGVMHVEAAEPSKEETKRFLIKAAAYEVVQGGFRGKDVISFEEDTLVIVTKQYRDGALTDTITVRVKLADLNPDRQDMLSNSVHFYVTEDEKRIKWTNRGPNEADHELNSYQLRFNEERKGKRIAKAMRHLIQLCGGQSDQFGE